MSNKPLSDWLDKLRGKKHKVVDFDSIDKKIKEYRKELEKYQPGSRKHLEIQSKINELKALKSN